MNTVTNLEKKNGPEKIFLSDLCGKNFQESKSAFLGTTGIGGYGLYLVTYVGISRADKPKTAWDYKDSKQCNVKVTKFVDINIEIVGDKNARLT